MFQKKFLLPVLALIALASCRHEAELSTLPLLPGDTTGGNGGNHGGNNSSIPCDPDTVYFQRDILPLLNSSCAYGGCHDSKSRADGVQLDNYNSIINTGEVSAGNPSESKIYKVITENDPDDMMPPPPKSSLTAAQVLLLRKWILQGAKNNHCSSCDSTSFKFSSDIMPIVEKNCKSCHSGSSPSGGLYLETYNDIKNTAASGKLLSVIQWKGAIKMPKSYQLDDCQIRKIEKWIANGSPND